MVLGGPSRSFRSAPPFSGAANRRALLRAPRRRAHSSCNIREAFMPLFIISTSWTDEGIRNVKDAPKRSKAARALGKKLGVEIKQIYLTSGDSDLLVIVDAQDGDSVAKFALAISSLGNVRTRTARAWTEVEFTKLIAELP
jgi:uncharacterized protein with GYD domain